MQSMILEQGLGLLFSNHKGSTSACLFKVIILSFFHSTIKIKGDNTHIKMAILIFYEYFCYISILYNFSPQKTFTYVSISSCYQRLLSVLLWQPNGIVTVVPSKARFFLSLKYFPLKKNSSTGSTWRQYQQSSTYRPTRRNRLVACCSEIIRRGKNKKKFMLRIYPVSQCFFDCFSKLFLNVSGIPNLCMLTRTSLTLPQCQVAQTCLNFPLKSKKEREGEGLALHQI